MFCLFFTGWIRYSERVLGSLVTPHICTARSPQQIMGCLVKDYFSKQQVSVHCRNLQMHLVFHWHRYTLLTTLTVGRMFCYSDQKFNFCVKTLFLPPAVSPSRSWVQRKSTTCWWPPALIRSWRLSERSFTTACWRPEMWTVSSPQVQSPVSYTPLPTDK